jgi:hypothetical protein
MKKYNRLIILLLSVVFSISVMAQQTKTIKGVVYDEHNDFVIGVNIRVNDSPIGTITNNEGQFTLSNVPVDKTSIVVSFIGYETQTVDITTQTDLRIVLVPSITDMTEVVVVGYGKQKRAHLNGGYLNNYSF